ncbi:MAG TPA: hypothetical protein VGD37_24545 [Kofleriaceae bacterium]
MIDPWQILRAGGVPLMLPASGLKVSADDLASATRAVIATQPSGRDAEALAAWIFAWQHHWPQSFAAKLGDAAASTTEWAARHTLDANRYLKLRRIALENLARLL